MNGSRSASVLVAVGAIVAACSSRGDSRDGAGASAVMPRTRTTAEETRALRAGVHPATALPVVSGETALDNPVAYVPASGSQTLPAVAWNGANNLVVWSDPRSALGGGTVIVGARVDSGGHVLDATGFDLSTASIGGVQNEVTPAIATEGGSGTFLVSWVDSGTIMTATVSGTTPSATTTLGLGTSNSAPAVAYTASDYLVVWQSGSGVVGTRVSTSNVAVEATPFTIAASCTSPPAIASNGTSYFVLCASSTTVYFSLVGANGVVGTQQSLPSGSPFGAIAAASDGNNFLACATKPTSGDQVGCVLLDGTLAAAVSTNINPGDGVDPTHPSLSIVYGDGQYILAYTTPGSAPGTYGLRGAIVNQDGSTPGADGGVGGVTFLDRGTTSAYPSLVAYGSQFGVVWQDDRNGVDASDIYGSGLSASLVASGTDEILSQDATSETNASLASDGTDLLVAYEHDGPTVDSAIDGVRVTLAGVPIDATPIALETPGGAHAPFVVDPGAISTGWGVFWGAGQIQGTGLSPSGSVSGLGILSTGTLASTPSAACDGTDCLVVWQDARNAGASGQDIYATILASSGGPVGDVPLVQATGDQLTPSVAWTSSGYLVSYVDGTGVSVILVTRSGTTLSPGASVKLTTASATYAHPQTASDGTSYFVVFDDGSTIWGANVLASGALSGSLLSLASTTGARGNAAVAWDGYQYVAAWQDSRNGNFDVFAGRVSGSTVIDPGGFPVTSALEDETNPAIVGEGGRISAVAYQSQHAGSSGPRVYVRTLSDKLATGATCTDGGECGTTFCVDTVCCASACTGSCKACSHALTNESDGVCASVVDDTDPHGSCTAPPPLSCESDTCVSGACAVVVSTGCLIGGACVPAGATNGTNECQTCQPAVSTTAYSDVATGTTCSDGNKCHTGNTCSGGTCSAGSPVSCTAPDSCHTEGDCQTATGTCPAPVLEAGFCDIASVCYASGTVDPGDACLVCDPNTSQVAWTATTCPDAGSGGSDGGSVGSDGGSVGSDGGSVGSDGGSVGSDGGSGGSDGGSVGSDSGVVGSDSGVVGSDSGVVGSDTGSPDEDGGVVESDSGSPDEDGGVVESDSGSVGEDGGPVGGDATAEDAAATASDDSGAELQVPGTSGGCGCRTAPTPASPPTASLAALLGVLFLGRRRRRRQV